MDASMESHMGCDCLQACPVLELPSHQTRPEIMSGQAYNVPFALSPAAYQQMRALASQNGATVIMCLTAAFQIVLGRWAQQEEVVVGSATLGRGRPELQHLIGYFVNMLPLRARLAQVTHLCCELMTHTVCCCTSTISHLAALSVATALLVRGTTCDG